MYSWLFGFCRGRLLCQWWPDSVWGICDESLLINSNGITLNFCFSANITVILRIFVTLHWIIILMVHWLEIYLYNKNIYKSILLNTMSN